MEVIIQKNRWVTLRGTAGTQNENRATILQFKYPAKYADFDKQIVFITDDGVFNDNIYNDKYKINQSITKYGTVKCYIRFYSESDVIDFRSMEFGLKFYENHEAEEAVESDETSIIEKIDELIITLQPLATESGEYLGLEDGGILIFGIE